MSSNMDKVKGAANEVAGNVKRSVGKALGNDRMEAEGEMQKAKGKTQQAVGKGKEAVKSLIDQA